MDIHYKDFKYEFKEYIVHKSEDHYIYSVPPKLILKLNNDERLKTWSGNRKPDKIRINELKKYLEKNCHVNGTLHFAYIIDEGFICYDGNHRRLALNLNISRVMVDILWNVGKKRIEKEFLAINQSISVPEIYVNPKFDNVVKNAILEYVDVICETYPDLSRSTNLCKKPGFNRDLLIQNITDIYKETHKENKKNIEFLLKCITKLNRAYNREELGFKKDRLTTRIKNDCVSSGGLWLFSKGREIDRIDLDKIIMRELRET